MAQPTSASPTPAAARTGRVVTIVLVGIGVLLVGLGWLIPSQFKSVPVSVLAEAGRDTPGLRDAVIEQLDSGRPGAASILAEAAVAVKLRGADALVERVQSYLADNPDLAVWGEASPYLDQALGREQAAALDPKAGIVRHLLPPRTRKDVGAYLEGSRNATVKALLATRELKSYRQFLPVFSAGGAPLESTILLAALLTQSQVLEGEAARELRALAEQANSTGDAVQLELVYLDLLALGRRYTWGQLAALARGAESLDTLARMRRLLQIAPEEAPVVYAAVVLSREADAVTDYVIKYGQQGSAAVAFALHHGTGSLALLLRQQLPVDGSLVLPPHPGEAGVARVAVDPLVRFAFRSPTLAVAAKFVAYLVGGLLLFLAGERASSLHRLELSPLFTYVARGVGAGVVCLFLLVLNEPYLALGSQPSGYQLHLVIPVLGTTSVDTMNEATKAFPVDAATVLTILFFFLLQSLVFLICRLKLREIEGKKVDSLVKLKLVESEDNLFDSGLYVGIAGTCSALVLQVIGVIEANLLAAYSSNLFGILCVAFIKIRHVRPFRNKIILEMAQAPATPAVPAQPARAG